MFTIGQSNFENGRGYAAAGLVQKKWAGYAGNENWTINRTMLYFDDISSFVPESGEVDKAELVLYEYEDLSGGKTVFTVSQLTKRLTFGDVQGHAGYSNHWDYFVANSTSREYLGRFTSGKGYKRVDITQTVNDWLKGIDGNYGLLLMADGENNTTLGARFYPGTGTEPDVPPCIEITWHEVGDVSSRYPIDDTIVNLRPINASDGSGKLEFYGVFWDGIATPDSTVFYSLSDVEKQYEGSISLTPGYGYLYPSTETFETIFPAGATKYRRRLSNWQTPLPFTDFEYDTIYSLTVHPEKNGVSGKKRPATRF